MKDLLSEYAVDLGDDQYAFEFEDLKEFEADVEASDEHQVSPIYDDEEMAGYLVGDSNGAVYHIQRGRKGVMQGSVSFEVREVETSDNLEDVASNLETDQNPLQKAADRTGEHVMQDPEPSNQEIIEGEGDLNYTDWGWADSAQDSDRLIN